MKNDVQLPDGVTAMWAEDYEKLQAEQRKKRAEEERLKAEADARAQKEFEETLPLRNQLPYSDELAQEICERVSAGELLIDICNELHMPTVRRANQWMRESPEFNTLFKESILDRLGIFEEQVIQIADDMSKDFKTITRNGKQIRVVDADVIARAKLRVDVRFKHLKAGKPQKWGDTTTLVTKNEGEDPADLSNEELERRLKDLDVKDRIFKVVP
jgi:hypothetical protein